MAAVHVASLEVKVTPSSSGLQLLGCDTSAALFSFQIRENVHELVDSSLHSSNQQKAVTYCTMNAKRKKNTSLRYTEKCF
ncbi:hypothetical protein JOB18_013805 [Solea senegalensis]|uniref:Uncharacterized protein n=1 Tax=Solea senegalensis TaxID=28829 RepID=A0AAV6R724_SOLSE|nr:hypothetical protein JOB18_013805 [Solea senegalensis]